MDNIREKVINHGGKSLVNHCFYRHMGDTLQWRPFEYRSSNVNLGTYLQLVIDDQLWNELCLKGN